MNVKEWWGEGVEWSHICSCMYILISRPSPHSLPSHLNSHTTSGPLNGSDNHHGPPRQQNQLVGGVLSLMNCLSHMYWNSGYEVS